MPRPSFAVVVASIVLLLSILYALTFSSMLYVSLQEQVFSHPDHVPRYVGRVHYHNPAEWILIVVPAVTGWLGIGACTVILTRHWLRLRGSKHDSEQKG